MDLEHQKEDNMVEEERRGRVIRDEEDNMTPWLKMK